MSSLESFVAKKLSELSLRDDPDTCSFVSGIVQEDSFEPEDKKLAILGMLEAEEDEIVADSVDELLTEAGQLRQAELDAERAEDERRAAEAREREAAKAAAKPLSPQDEAARRAELVKAYGLVEEEEAENEANAEGPDKKKEDELGGDKPFVDPRYMSKKARKKAEQGVDILMQPNMNAAIVKMAEQHRRKEDSVKAAAKRNKDKADLQKQKEDAAKKLADKQKKAQKHERRA